jgi:TPR repeat protein
LARAYRQGTAGPRDDALAVRLLELAVARGHVQARWELALLLRQGSGVERDLSRALALAKDAAEAGDGAGMNILGVMIRDGIGRSRDDAEARSWFERSADLLNSHGMTNLGRFYKEGRGGLGRDSARAVALWRTAANRDDNPSAQFMLAAALESGDGVPQDVAEARIFYAAAAEQNREPEIKMRAIEAMKRLAKK